MTRVRFRFSILAVADLGILIVAALLLAALPTRTLADSPIKTRGVWTTVAPYQGVTRPRSPRVTAPTSCCCGGTRACWHNPTRRGWCTGTMA